MKIGVCGDRGGLFGDFIRLRVPTLKHCRYFCFSCCLGEVLNKGRGLTLAELLTPVHNTRIAAQLGGFLGLIESID